LPRKDDPNGTDQIRSESDHGLSCVIIGGVTVNKNQTVKSVLETALEALNRELEKDPLSPERIMAISKAIEVLVGIKPLQLP